MCGRGFVLLCLQRELSLPVRNKRIDLCTPFHMLAGAPIEEILIGHHLALPNAPRPRAHHAAVRHQGEHHEQGHCGNGQGEQPRLDAGTAPLTLPHGSNSVERSSLGNGTEHVDENGDQCECQSTEHEAQTQKRCDDHDGDPHAPTIPRPIKETRDDHGGRDHDRLP